MATYRVQGPDGRVIVIEGPEGASQDQIIQAAQSLYAGADTKRLADLAAGSTEQAGQQALRDVQGVIDRRARPDAPSGFLRGLKDPIDAGAQLLPRGLEQVTSLFGTAPNPVSKFFGNEAKRVDEMVSGDEAAYQQARQQAGDQGFDASRLAGNVLNPANIGLGYRAMASLPQATSALGRGLRSLPVGAALGATQPVYNTEDFGSEKLTQAGVGAALGPVSEIGASALSRAIRPNIDESARALMREGVEVTPGQLAGGLLKRIEDASTATPILGDVIRSSQRRGVESLNKAAYQRALSPVGEKLPKDIGAGRDAVQYVASTLGRKYDELLPKMTFVADDQFTTELAKIRQMAQGLPDQQAKRFERVLTDQIGKKMEPSGRTDGSSFKSMQSELRRLSQNYRKSQSPDDRDLGDALGSVALSMRQAAARNTPELADELAKLDKAWANYKVVERAAGSQAATEGVFSPQQLASAVRGQSRGQGQFARGNALMQDLADPARAVLPSSIPDSGTVPRMMMNAATIGGGLTMAPQALVGLGAASGLYTRPGQALARGLLLRPQGADPIAQLARQYGQVPQLAGLVPLTQDGP